LISESEKDIDGPIGLFPAGNFYEKKEESDVELCGIFLKKICQSFTDSH